MSTKVLSWTQQKGYYPSKGLRSSKILIIWGKKKHPKTKKNPSTVQQPLGLLCRFLITHY